MKTPYYTKFKTLLSHLKTKKYQENELQKLIDVLRRKNKWKGDKRSFYKNLKPFWNLLHDDEIEIKEIQDNDFGIFAKKDIQRGTHLKNLFGFRTIKNWDFTESSVILIEKKKQRRIKGEKIKKVVLQSVFCKKYQENCATLDGPLYFANHSFKPNMKVLDDLKTVTTKKIKRGEQILWNYGHKYFEERNIKVINYN